MSSDIYKPLVPLPQQEDCLDVPTNLSAGGPSSPFTSLFDPPSSAQASVASTGRPLFPNLSGDVRQHRKTSGASLKSISRAVESPSSPYGDFVEFDPLQSTTTFCPISSPVPTKTSPVPNPVSVRVTSSGQRFGANERSTGAFNENLFVQQAAARSLERNESVMKGLSNDNLDDPLGWLSGHQKSESCESPPFNDWDGMGDDADEEIADHTLAPLTPRASPMTQTPVEGVRKKAISSETDESDDDILDLKTGKRERRSRKAESTQIEAEAHPASSPISIASSPRAAHEGHRHHVSSPKSSGSVTTSSSYFNTFTLPRTWFSSSSISPTVTQPVSLPKSGLTRQNSVGEFSDLPAPDLKVFEQGSPTLRKHSPRFSITGIFDHPPTIPEQEVSSTVTSNPLSRKIFIPATGAPGFRPQGNWNPEGFVYDSHSKKDTLGREKVLLLGRKPTAIPVLSQSVADSLRGHFPALPRLAQSWTLLYSTDQHGISISTMYKNVEKVYGQGGGCLLAIQEVDTEAESLSAEPLESESGWGRPCFGIWIGAGMKCLEGAYYGSGESFLWKTSSLPDQRVRANGVKVFKWTARNEYVALCDADSISFGGGDGRYGLYIDSSFVDGLSEQCDTFGNEVLCRAVDVNGRGRFECMVLEVWHIG